MNFKEITSMKKLLAVLGALCALAAGTAVAGWVYSAYLVNSTVTANSNYTLNLNTTPNAEGINHISAQAVYSSATVPTNTFNDGKAATGTITISNPTNLIGVVSTATVSVVSNNIIGYAKVFLTTPGRTTVLYVNNNWYQGNTSSNTAVSIAQAINYQTTFIGFTASTTSANTVTVTCPTTGTNCNGATLTVNTSSLTASGAFSGGNNNAVLTINGVPLTQGNQWTATSFSSATATSIASAINGSSSLSAIMAAQAIGSVVYATTTATGIATNYAWSSSNTGSMTLLNSTGLSGGTNSAYQINSGVIHIPSHGLATGYGVTYSTGSGVTITPLVTGTVYYAISVDANDIELASSLANATAGTYITLTSQSTTGPHTFTLTPQPYTGTASMAWYGSVDCVNYNPVSISSLTITSPTTAPQSTLWNFGRINYTCLQLQVIAPTQGGLNLAVKVNGKN